MIHFKNTYIQNQSNWQQNSQGQKGTHFDSKQNEEQTVQPNASVMSNKEGKATTENVTQRAMEDWEVAPEFGDAVTSEVLGLHHRDE